MPRILSIGHSYVVGLNRRLCRELARKSGVELTVAAPARFPGDLREIELEPNSSSDAYELAPIRVRMGKIPHVFTYDPSSLRKLMKTGGFDVVHAWEEPYIMSGAEIALLKPKRTKLVYSTFQNINKRYPPPFSTIERYSMRKAAGWTAFGSTIAENLASRPGYRDKPSATIPLGVDLDAFIPRPEAGAALREKLGWSEPGPPVVGYLGRMVAEKGVELLMDVLDGLPEGSKRALFVGGGPLLPKVRRMGGGEANLGAGGHGSGPRRSACLSQRNGRPCRAKPNHSRLARTAWQNAPGSNGQRDCNGRQRFGGDSLCSGRCWAGTAGIR